MENTSPPTIQLDVFGFSRGAAMARHFVNCIKQNYFDFKDPDINEAFSSYSQIWCTEYQAAS